MQAALLLLLLAVPQQPAAPRDVAPAPPGAVISGRVTERGSGRPLPRIVVTLARTGPSPLVTVTGDDGRYEFTGVEPGAYALSAGPDRHRSTYLQQRYGAAAPGPSEVEPPRPNIELAAGEQRSGLDIALWRSLAIEGRVLDPWENGMANVPVQVKRIGERIRSAGQVFTDDRGMYRAYGLAPGRYRVCAEIAEESDTPPDGERLGDTCHPAAASESDASEIVLSSQDATAIDIRIQQFRSFSISGFVVGANGSPVQTAFVGAYPLEERGPSATVSTDGGEFVLNGLAPGRYMVRASVTEPNPGEGPPQREVEMGFASVDLAAGDVAGVTVTLSKPVDVSGRVTFEGGRPRSNTRLGMVVQTGPAAERLMMISAGRPPFSAVGDDLSFELKRVFRLPMIVRMYGLPDGWVLKSVLYDGRDVTYVPTEFGSGPGRLEVILTNRVAQPMVRVLDEDGRAITSCHVIAVPADPATWRLAVGFIPSAPGPDDQIKLGPMLAGDYIIAAIPRDQADLLFIDRTRVDALATIGTRVTLAEGDTRTLEVKLTTLPAKQ